MSTLPSFSSPTVRNKFLLHASPELVYSYLQANPINKYEESTLAENLLERGDIIIDLALASFSQVSNVIQELLERKDKEIIIAVCENICTSPTDLIDIQTFKNILNDKEDDRFKREFLHSFFSNKIIDYDDIGHLFEGEYKTNYFSYENLTDDELDQCIVPMLQHVIYFKDVNSRDHPFSPRRLSQRRWDFIDDVQRRMFPCIGKSLIRLEPTKNNRNLLNSCIEKMCARTVTMFDLWTSYPVFDTNDILNFLDLSHKDNDEGYAEAEIKFLDITFKKWEKVDEECTEEGSQLPRSTLLANIARCITSGYSAMTKTSWPRPVPLYLENHPQLSVRSGYYRGYEFSRGDEVKFETYYKKDKGHFLSSVVLNKFAYSWDDPKLRERLNQLIDEENGNETIDRDKMSKELYEKKPNDRRYRLPEEEETAFVTASKLQLIKLVDTTPLLDKIEEDIEKIQSDKSTDDLEETLINISKMIHGVNRNILQVYTKLSSMISKVQRFTLELQRAGRTLFWIVFIFLAINAVFDFFWTT